MWSIVASCFAATIGWIIGAWVVANTHRSFVCASRPQAHVSVSSVSSCQRDGPP